jgi:hypothetical protein
VTPKVRDAILYVQNEFILKGDVIRMSCTGSDIAKASKKSELEAHHCHSAWGAELSTVTLKPDYHCTHH